MTDHELVERAKLARKMAYIPYSHFAVGAALLTRDGKVYTGCNIENSTFTPTNCAERTALFKAVSEGEREFEAIAVVGGPEGDTLTYTPPCGVCRQALAEFCHPEFRILLGQNDGSIRVFSLIDLLPEIFLLEEARKTE